MWAGDGEDVAEEGAAGEGEDGKAGKAGVCTCVSFSVGHISS